MRNKLTFAALLFFPFLGACQPEPPDLNYLPAHTSQDDIIRHAAYTLKYSEPHEQAAWVAYVLTAERVGGTHKRTDNFRPDPLVKTGSAQLSDYKGSGYDRGHLAPAGDMKWSHQAMSESFYMSNMSPQRPGFNRGIWKNLESLVRTLAVRHARLYVVTGPVLSNGLPTIGRNKVAVPEYYYKVLLAFNQPDPKAIGFVLPNTASKRPLIDAYAVTIDSVESLTGIDFFPALPDSLENALESRIQTQAWSWGTPLPKPVDVTSFIFPTRDSVAYCASKKSNVFHRSSCRYAKKISRHNLITFRSRKEALDSGRRPCKDCNP